jgi:hypothetical protein
MASPRTFLDESGPLTVEQPADEVGIDPGGGLHHAILSAGRYFANGSPGQGHDLGKLTLV